MTEEDTTEEQAYCRHCGEPAAEDVEAGADFQCAVCERYQDSMTCPTCGSNVRISLLAADFAPPVHEPKAKE